MSRPTNQNDNDGLSVDFTNRPSDRRGSHTAGEWSDHIYLREADETRRDIRSARERLGQFSVRFVTEAIYGEDVARKIWGDDGGEVLVRDVVIDRKVLTNLSDNVGGARSQQVSQRIREEVPEPRARSQPKQSVQPVEDVGQQQVELLRALLRTMDPNVVKKALLGG